MVGKLPKSKKRKKGMKKFLPCNIGKKSDISSLNFGPYVRCTWFMGCYYCQK